MRALLVNSNDELGGAARATYRLMQGLREQGVDVQMLVQNRTSGDPLVIGPEGFFDRGLALARPHWDALPVRKYRGRTGELFSPNRLSDKTWQKVNTFNPDLAHLNWVNGGFLKIENVARIRAPIVWTFHDMWGFTGGCHVTGGCERWFQQCGVCPVLGSESERDLSRKVWARKHRFWGELNFAIVTPSNWLADCVRRSSLLGDKDVRVIPVGIDCDVFAPLDRRNARNLMRLPQDVNLILFGAVKATGDRNKGFHLLQPALQRLAVSGSNAELLVFGAHEPPNAPDFGLKAHYLGNLHDDLTLRALYSAANVTVVPSLQDNYPQVALESLACGTPVVGFDVTGLPDLVVDGQTGALAKPYESESLAEAIRSVLSLTPGSHAEMSANARAHAVAKSGMETVAAQYKALYEEVIAKAGAHASCVHAT